MFLVLSSPSLIPISSLESFRLLWASGPAPAFEFLWKSLWTEVRRPEFGVKIWSLIVTIGKSHCFSGLFPSICEEGMVRWTLFISLWLSRGSNIMPSKSLENGRVVQIFITTYIVVCVCLTQVGLPWQNTMYLNNVIYFLTVLNTEVQDKAWWVSIWWGLSPWVADGYSFCCVLTRTFLSTWVERQRECFGPFFLWRHQSHFGFSRSRPHLHLINSQRPHLQILSYWLELQHIKKNFFWGGTHFSPFWCTYVLHIYHFLKFGTL